MKEKLTTGFDVLQSVETEGALVFVGDSDIFAQVRAARLRIEASTQGQQTERALTETWSYAAGADPRLLSWHSGGNAKEEMEA
ncbi:hypothetical protein [Ferrimicrobium sp.]|uniref:hypothetical protein n=1 Tax=Ferrimicrobium sp. TaxID=2926050 RepID=UPI00262DC9C7|nr:hypothetical protein [Ferrimicrobium sp.]